MAAVSPVKKNKRGQVVHEDQKIIVLNIYKTLKTNNPRMLYEETVNTLSRMTGIGRCSTKKIITEYNRTGRVSEPDLKKRRLSARDKIDEFEKNAIRRKVHDFYRNDEVPRMNKVLRAVNDDDDLPDFKKSTFHKLLHELNFTFTKRQRNSALTERTDLVTQRREYIRTIERYRKEGRSIYYLDETWVDVGDADPSGKGKCLIVLHIGSAAGFVPGGLLCFAAKKNTADHLEEIDDDIFLEWFNKVLPTLDEKCAIVMDDAPYHCAKHETLPDTSWRRATIVEWLQSKGKEVDDTMVKAELLHIVGLEKEKFDKYKVDEIARGVNKTVLRLPPFHSELNPFDLVWSMVKGYVKTNNATFKLSDVEKLLEEGVARVTAEHWNIFLTHTMEVEKKFWEIDGIVDRLIDQIPPLANNARAETESSSDDDD